MQPILYLIQKEFRQIFRDRAMVFILFFAPMVQMVVLGFAITVDVKNVATVIADYDDSAASRELVRKFEHNGYFTIVARADGPAQIRRLLDDWDARFAVVIPHDFARRLRRGLQPSVQLIADGIDGNSAGIALGYASSILMDFSAEQQREATLLSRAMRALQPGTQAEAGDALSSSTAPPQLVLSNTRMWYNLDLESKNYMVPGLIAVLLTMIGMFLSSMGLVREKELGTLEQLMVTPIQTWQLILGKVIPFWLLGFVELAAMLAVAFIVFQLQVAGSLALLFGLAGVYLLSMLGLGMLISTLAQTQQQAMFISWFFMIFLIFMSGFLFPIENMPHLVQQLTYLDPLRYFVIILREIFLKGSSAGHLISETWCLVGFAILILGFSSLKFQKRVR